MGCASESGCVQFIAKAAVTLGGRTNCDASLHSAMQIDDGLSGRRYRAARANAATTSEGRLPLLVRRSPSDRNSYMAEK
jgi:hypothetical protein